MAHEPLKCQRCPHIDTSQLMCSANQLTGFYMRTTLALDGLSLLIRDHSFSTYAQNFPKKTRISNPLMRIRT